MTWHVGFVPNFPMPLKSSCNPWSTPVPRILILMVCVWSAGLSGSAFCILKLTGLLRISEDVEDTGMDSHHHSPPKAGGVRELGS